MRSLLKIDIPYGYSLTGSVSDISQIQALVNKLKLVKEEVFEAKYQELNPEIKEDKEALERLTVRVNLINEFSILPAEQPQPELPLEDADAPNYSADPDPDTVIATREETTIE